MIPQATIDRLCQIPIADYLASKGYLPVRQAGGQLLYSSPLREEKTASFFVHPVKNVWSDMGGDRGNIIRLVRHLDKCNFIVAVWILEQFTGLPQDFAFFFSDQLKDESLKKKDFVTAVKLHENPTLMQYTARRKISYPIARKYLRDVYYSFTSGKKPMFGVGFQNDKEGWALSSKMGKVNIGHTAPTTITVPGSTVVNLFEGFFDFLSALEHYQLNAPRCTTIVLNSLSNIEQALPLLWTFTGVNAYLDNDQPGRDMVVRLRQEGIATNDRSALYGDFKDFNEYLTNSNGNR